MFRGRFSHISNSARTAGALTLCPEDLLIVMRLTRRRAIGLMSSGGLILATAGCVGDDDNDDEEPDPVEDHLADANGYDGTWTDLTNEEQVDIDVGDPEGGRNYMFGPPAAYISEGTTVVWTWIDDERHSVTHNDNDFDSGIHSDFTFEWTFEEEQTVLYHCRPHIAVGHLGALIVE